MSTIILTLVEDELEPIQFVGIGENKEEALDSLAEQIVHAYTSYCVLPIKKIPDTATRLKYLMQAIDKQYVDSL